MSASVRENGKEAPVEGQARLRVLESYTIDVGRGVARIDYDAMHALWATTGDVVEILGKRRTLAKCLPLAPSDEKREMIRFDGLIRINAGVSIGDTVTIKKVNAPPAEKVVVAPLEAIPPIDERYIRDVLEGVPVTKGDNIMIPYLGGRLTFQIVAASPVADAVVTKNTLFVIAGEATIPISVLEERIKEYQKQHAEELQAFVEQDLQSKPEQIVKHFGENRFALNRVLWAMNDRGYLAVNVSVLSERVDAGREYAIIFMRKDALPPR